MAKNKQNTTKYYLQLLDEYNPQFVLETIKLKDNTEKTLKVAIDKLVADQGFYGPDYMDGDKWPKVKFLSVIEEKTISLKPFIKAYSKVEQERVEKLNEASELALYKELHERFGKIKDVK